MEIEDGNSAEAVDENFILDVSTKQKGMWLIKIPATELCAAIDFAEDNEQLGEMIKFDTKKSKKRKASGAFDLKVDDNLRTRFEARPERPGAIKGKRGKLLKSFKIDSKQTPPSISVFTEEKDPETKMTSKVELYGAINMEAQINSDLQSGYDDVANRFKAKNAAAHNVQEAKEIKSNQMVNHYNPYGKNMKEARSDEAAKKKYKAQNMTSSYGITDDDIKQRLFEKFAEFEYWQFIDLNKKLKLPQVRVKNVLKEIAQYETKGEHKMRWRLKSVYTTHH